MWQTHIPDNEWDGHATQLIKTVSEWVGGLVKWNEPNPDNYVPFDTQSRLMTVIVGMQPLTPMIKFKEDGKKFAMKLICMNTFQYDRQGIRHALIKMIRAEIMKIKQTTHVSGGTPGYEFFNFHIKMPGCEINSKWSETMSMCKLCIKAKRVKTKRQPPTCSQTAPPLPVCSSGSKRRHPDPQKACSQ
jgi:hypothetical protein